MTLNFNVETWNVWPPISPGEDDQVLMNQYLSVLPKLLKRRLSPLARTVFASLIPCLNNDAATIPVIFSSSHGELERSLHMMKEIAKGESISPTTFSLSVHNSIAGLFAIMFANKLENTVIAPAEEGIAAGLIETIAMLNEGWDRVIVVFYDAPLPDFYPAQPFKLSAPATQAVTLRLYRDENRPEFTLTRIQATGNDGEQTQHLPLLIDFLKGRQTDLYLRNRRHGWHIQKHVEGI
jgi:hypothetical protein